MNAFKTLIKSWNKSTLTQKVFYVSSTLLLIHIIAKLNRNDNIKEGFDKNNTKTLTTKRGNKVYDEFYASIYDDLLHSEIKNKYEIDNIMKITTPNKKSIVLDVGSGTGHHVNAFTKNGVKSMGIDISPAMVNKSKELFPSNEFRVGDVLKTMNFQADTLTHITCLYFTIYYIENKKQFFNNCMHWLLPGGYLILHLVDRDNFDPIIPAGDPFMIVSPQKYADKRITSTVVKFDDFEYKANFDVVNDNDIAILNEMFKYKDNSQLRKNEHKLYMAPQRNILSMAKDAGFLLKDKLDMTMCQYADQYLYILQKPDI